MNKVTNFLCLSLLLLGAGAVGMNTPDELLWSAVRRGSLEVAKTSIEQGASVTAKDIIECTPLYYAAMHGHEAVCKLLIEKKASIDAKNHIGWTPLRIASMNGRDGVCKLLIDVQLELARKDKAAIVTFLGIMKKRKSDLSRCMDYNVARIVDRMAFQIVRQKNWSMIEQINKLDRAKAKWLAYLNEQMNSVNK